MRVPRLRPSFSLADLFNAAIKCDSKSESLFERSFAEKFSFPYGLFFPYGRSALFSLLGAMEWKGAEIVMPAYTCVVMPHAVVLSGNQVRFVDCPSNHFNVSPEDLSSVLSSTTKMVIPTPLFGYPLERKDYKKTILQASPQAFILHDAAQSYKNTNSDENPLDQADGAIFSFGVGKLLCSLYGGMLLLRDKDIFQAVKEYRDHYFSLPSRIQSFKKWAYGLAVWSAFRNPVLNITDFLEKKTNLLYRFTDYYYGKQGPTLPSNLEEKPTSIEAQLGRIQLTKFNDILKRRKDIASFYEQNLAKAGIPFFECNVGATYSQFPLVIECRDQMVQELFEMGIQVGSLIDYACPDLPGYESHKGTCPNASWFADRMINLPIWDGISRFQAKKIIRALQILQDRHSNIFPVL